MKHPTPPADVWSRGRRPRRSQFPFAKLIAAVMSLVVLGATGYAWATLRTLNSGLTTTDVLGDPLPNPPDGAIDILLVGNDNRTDAQGNPLPKEVLEKLRAGRNEGQLTDTMILVRIPNNGKRAAAVSFPRDVEVEMAQDYGEHKLNSAWARGKNESVEKLKEQGVTDPKELESRATKAGQKLLIQTIEKFSGVTIDHYAEVNLLGFYEITKAIGGIKVCLREPVDDPYSGAHFEAGPQVIQGANALAFVRQRHGLPRGDLDRVVRQQVFMASLAKKLLSSGTLTNPAKLSELIAAVQKSVVLDSGWNVLQFAKQMQGIASGDIEFYTIPTTPDPDTGNPSVEDPEVVQDFVASLLQDPATRKRQQAKAADSTSRSDITVNVYNASEVSGLAGRVLEQLGEEGFTKGEAANAEAMSGSVVYYAKGEQEQAKQVAESLGGLSVQPSDNLDSGSVAVYLGSGYSGPGAQSSVAGDKLTRLDGLRQRGPQPAQQPDSGTPKITAGGVPCVY